jgi:hypothetical protein
VGAARIQCAAVVMIFVSANIAAPVETVPEESMSSFVSRAKRWARKENPRFRPFVVQENGTEWFFLLVGQSEFDLIKGDPDIHEANKVNFRSSTEWGKNPIFMDDDYLYNGVILRLMRPGAIPKKPTDHD